MARIAPLLAVLVLLSPLAAQTPPMERGDAHRRLDFLVGTWNVESRYHMRDRVHDGGQHVTEVRWLPGGVWLEESTEVMRTPVGEMFGSARIAWDANENAYVRHWIDNQTHVVMPMRGNFVDDTTLEFRGSFQWLDGTTYHQRLIVRKEAEGGWSQTGFMGSDPEKLRMNHEGRARRIAGTDSEGEHPAPAEATPAVADPSAPEWLQEHMAFMTRDGGRWLTDNAAYRSDQEPFDAYGTEWRWGPGRRSVTGRLFGLIDGEEQGTFWEFRLVWDPARGQAILHQFGANGVVGSGPMVEAQPGVTHLDQRFAGPDGSSSRIRHRSRETGEDRHVTESFDVTPDGESTPRRQYTWVRDR